MALSLYKPYFLFRLDSILLLIFSYTCSFIHVQYSFKHEVGEKHFKNAQSSVIRS